MCGVVGYISNKVEETKDLSIINKMSETLSHRGPDSGNSISYNNIVYLGHRRLSILGVGETGSQPMSSISGRYVISFNGEIYNHHNLRHILEKNINIKWKSNSDTETLVELFDHLGIKNTLNKISGMFSISLLDKKEKKYI